MTGSPGIGKSRGLTYLLRLLLKEKETVVFESRKEGRVFLFTFDKVKKGYIVQSHGTDSGSWLDDIRPILDDDTKWYLVDP